MNEKSHRAAAAARPALPLSPRPVSPLVSAAVGAATDRYSSSFQGMAGELITSICAIIDNLLFA